VHKASSTPIVLVWKGTSTLAELVGNADGPELAPEVAADEAPVAAVDEPTGEVTEGTTSLPVLALLVGRPDTTGVLEPAVGTEAGAVALAEDGDRLVLASAAMLKSPLMAKT